MIIIKILAIESSCDETACAVVENGRTILSSVIASQIDEHKLYGGVVPEIASRLHVESIVPITEQALEQSNISIDDIDAIAVTYSPGLIGALLVGVNFAKALAFAKNKPLIPVHHIRGHIAANYLAYPELKPPFLCLVASGGHSHIIEVLSYTEFRTVGQTCDDAAGEAYDKVARILGFPYPGGKYIDKASENGDPLKYKLPTPKVSGSEYNFSFSGLKTAVINLVHNAEQKNEPIDKDSLAASFQHVAVNMLTSKTILAAKNLNYDKIVLAGGVSANSGLRKKFEEECKLNNIKLYTPPIDLCGDNAAMIGSQAYYEFLENNIAGYDLNAVASMDISQSRF